MIVAQSEIAFLHVEQHAAVATLSVHVHALAGKRYEHSVQCEWLDNNRNRFDRVLDILYCKIFVKYTIKRYSLSCPRKQEVIYMEGTNLNGTGPLLGLNSTTPVSYESYVYLYTTAA